MSAVFLMERNKNLVERRLVGIVITFKRANYFEPDRQSALLTFRKDFTSNDCCFMGKAVTRMAHVVHARGHDDVAGLESLLHIKWQGNSARVNYWKE